MTGADDDDTRDRAANCDGERRERAVRDGGDSGVVMMSGQQRRMTAKADNDSDG